MGSLKAELRRFEKRRLRPILQRLKRRQQQPHQAVPSSEPMQQLLVALLRAEMRRADPKAAGWSGMSSTLPLRLTRHQDSTSSELEDLVRTMLATPAAPGGRYGRRDAA